MIVFIAGPRVIKELDANIIKRLEKICKKQYELIIGDADGIDTSVQRYLSDKKYNDVIIFASNGKVRNNVGNWKSKNVQVSKDIKGFDFYVAKDLEMAKKADYGFMIWNGESKGTFNNIINLIKLNKEFLLYYTPSKKFYTIKNMEQLDKFIEQNKKLSSKLLKLIPKNVPNFVQMSIEI
jgi:hypothetical protein